MSAKSPEWYRAQYTDRSFTYAVTAAAKTAVELLAVKSASHRIFVQKVVLAIHTHADGKLIALQDDAGTPVVICEHEDEVAAAGVPSTVVLLDSARGVPLTLGKNLDIDGNASGSGMVATLTVECYEKLDTPISYLAGASLQ